MAVTPEFNLPYPEPSSTTNVPRDFKALADAVESAMQDLGVDVLDVFDSTDKTLPPSADALRRGLETKQNTVRLADNYLAASVLVNAAPDAQGRSYPDGLSFFKVSSSAGGWPTANGYVLTFRAGSGGYQIFYEMYTGAVQTDKTARQWTRSKRDSNTFWQDWARAATEVDIAALLPLTGGVMTGPVSRTINQFARHSQNVGGGFRNAVGAGWIKITIPVAITAPTDAASINATIDITQLLAVQLGCQLKIKGRPTYTPASSSFVWRDLAADVDRQPHFNKVQVGTDGTNLCILLGDATVSWSYAALSITELFVAGNQNSLFSASDWTISLVPDLTGISNIVDVPIKISATTEYANSVLTSAKADATVKASEAEANAKTYTDQKPWQKHKLTTDDGLGQNISNQNLNDYRRGGTYLGENLANAPTTGAGQWYIVEVQSMDPSATTGYVKQVAKSIFSNSYRERTCVAGTWSAWSEDLFTSVVNGKNDVKQAGISKGGTFNQAGSVPTFAELVAGINSIVLGYKAAPGETLLYNFGVSGNNPNPTYTRQMFMRTNIPGTFRLRYTVSNSGSGLGYARVYKNGVAYGAERVLNPGSPTTVAYVEDLAFAAGDTIEFWTRAQTTNSNNVSIADARALGATAIFTT